MRFFGESESTSPMQLRPRRPSLLEREARRDGLIAPLGLSRLPIGVRLRIVNGIVILLGVLLAGMVRGEWTDEENKLNEGAHTVASPTPRETPKPHPKTKTSSTKAKSAKPPTPKPKR